MLSTVQTPYNNFTGDGSTLAFTVDFAVFRAADLYVYLDDVIDTGYTVTDLGVLTGATITFAVAPALNVVIHVHARPLATRDTEYQTNGDILAASLNRDFDRIWNFVQASLLPSVVEIAASHTLLEIDNNTVLRMNSASAMTLTINTALAVKGFSFIVIQGGAGQITFNGTATLRNYDAHTKTAGQYAAVGFVCDKTGEFNFSGKTV